jgi:hypothetical protein
MPDDLTDEPIASDSIARQVGQEIVASRIFHEALHHPIPYCRSV